jgi:hypothetical protein
MFADGFHEVGAALLRGFRKGAKENAGRLQFLISVFGLFRHQVR